MYEIYQAYSDEYDQMINHQDYLGNGSGMFIDSNLKIPAGSALMLAYHPPQQGPTKRVGQVVWSNSAGMGIRLPVGG